jgi:hypothetical protein
LVRFWERVSCFSCRFAPIVVYVQKLSSGDCSTSKLALFMFVWIWDERSLRSRRKSGARERAIETELDASTMTDLAAVRSVDAGPYIVKECASRRVIDTSPARVVVLTCSLKVQPTLRKHI